MAESQTGDAYDCGHLQGFGVPDAKPTRLQLIVQQRELDVKEAKLSVSQADLEKKAAAFLAEHGKPRNLIEALEASEKSPWKLALAAEFKRASPSKGDINIDLDAAKQALEYTKEGAAILSVLTEPKWFKGSLEDLKAVRLTTQAWAKEKGVGRPACLRKDFVIDSYQVLEAVASGADTVLLMVSILSRSKLKSLIELSRSHGLEPLVEVVTIEELKVALSAGAKVLGVNNRNLHTFELDKQRTAQIAHELRETFKLPFGPGAEMKLLALSGLSVPEDVEECRALPCSGVLVGETLMRAPEPGPAIVELMGGPASGAAGASSTGALPVAPGAVVVKVCGVVRPEDANCAVSAGANMIGVIFAKSKRGATVDQAKAVVDEVRKFGERTQLIGAPARDGTDFGARSALLRSACKRTPLVVGVFLDQPLEEVVEKASGSCVDAVQLHGGEDVAFVRSLREKLPDLWMIKVVHLPPRSDAPDDDAVVERTLKERLLQYAEVCDALLLDTAVKGSHSGGTGAAFDWKVASRVQDEWQLPVIVAGGLTDENIGELVTSVKPFGVDVASGVEDSPGIKNVGKTTAYVKGAKRARVAVAA
mmetsp:Transcript_85000/g.177646  ORF Transcript_85000/g.177646 Transcript_85000/m.177646 type:complete len:592 (+) Transcript_85000:79-1854(+)